MQEPLQLRPWEEWGQGTNRAIELLRAGWEGSKCGKGDPSNIVAVPDIPGLLQPEAEGNHCLARHCSDSGNGGPHFLPLLSDHPRQVSAASLGTNVGRGAFPLPLVSPANSSSCTATPPTPRSPRDRGSGWARPLLLMPAMGTFPLPPTVLPCTG